LSKYEAASHYDLEATVAMDVETAPVSQRILMELWQRLDMLQEPNF
jgi:ubiquinone biosynthesis protein COQ9